MVWKVWRLRKKRRKIWVLRKVVKVSNFLIFQLKNKSCLDWIFNKLLRKVNALLNSSRKNIKASENIGPWGVERQKLKIVVATVNRKCVENVEINWNVLTTFLLRISASDVILFCQSSCELNGADLIENFVERDDIRGLKMKTFSMKPSPAASTSKPTIETDFSGDKLTSTLFGCLSVNARTVQYRRFYLFQMICFPFIPILALFIQNLTIFLEQIDAYQDTLQINQQVWV